MLSTQHCPRGDCAAPEGTLVPQRGLRCPRGNCAAQEGTVLPQRGLCCLQRLRWAGLSLVLHCSRRERAWSRTFWWHTLSDSMVWVEKGPSLKSLSSASCALKAVTLVANVHKGLSDYLLPSEAAKQKHRNWILFMESLFRSSW